MAIPSIFIPDVMYMDADGNSTVGEKKNVSQINKPESSQGNSSQKIPYMVNIHIIIIRKVKEVD